jgi:hypothetical protein
MNKLQRQDLVFATASIRITHFIDLQAKDTSYLYTDEKGLNLSLYTPGWRTGGVEV